MANRFEKWSFTPELLQSLDLSEPPDSLEEHRERIESKLRTFLSAKEARETAMRVHNLALEIDEEIGRILRDPQSKRLYDYDGVVFICRGARLLHVTLDGNHLLESLSGNNIESFFRGRKKHAAIRFMLEELGKHAEVARIRRMNWEESHSLGMIPQEMLEAILESIRERSRKAETERCPLSPEEQAFFRSFEEQMERQG